MSDETRSKHGGWPKATKKVPKNQMPRVLGSNFRSNFNALWLSSIRVLRWMDEALHHVEIMANCLLAFAGESNHFRAWVQDFVQPRVSSAGFCPSTVSLEPASQPFKADPPHAQRQQLPNSLGVLNNVRKVPSLPSPCWHMQGSLHYTPEHCLANGGFP